MGGVTHPIRFSLWRRCIDLVRGGRRFHETPREFSRRKCPRESSIRMLGRYSSLLTMSLVISGCSNDHFPLDSGEETIPLEGPRSTTPFQSRDEAQAFLEEDSRLAACQSTDAQNLTVTNSEFIPVHVPDGWGIAAVIDYEIPEGAETGERSMTITCGDEREPRLAKSSLEINVYRSRGYMYLRKGLIKVGIALVLFFFSYCIRDLSSVDVPTHGDLDNIKAAQAIKYFPGKVFTLGLIVFLVGVWQILRALFF